MQRFSLTALIIALMIALMLVSAACGGGYDNIEETGIAELHETGRSRMTTTSRRLRRASASQARESTAPWMNMILMR